MMNRRPPCLKYKGWRQRTTLAWLERGYTERTALMALLKVEPKWNNLHDDPRFQVLMQGMAFLL